MIQPVQRGMIWARGMCLAGVLLGSMPVAMAIPEPLSMVQKTSNEMLTAIKAERSQIDKDKGRLFTLVEKIVLPHFDFDRMAKLVLGKYWNRASDEQRRNFVEEFRFLLVRTYATAMLEYTDQKINYLPYRAGSDVNEATVQTEVEQDGGFPVPIDYKLYLDNGDWKVYEVSIDGVGLCVGADLPDLGRGGAGDQLPFIVFYRDPG